MTDIFHARAKALGKDTEVYMAFAQLASSVFGARASLPFWTPFTLETFLSSWTSQQIQDSLNLTKASKVKALPRVLLKLVAPQYLSRHLQ